jgi:hypothetical protein
VNEASNITGHGADRPDENPDENLDENLGENTGVEHGDVPVADWYIEALKFILASILESNEQDGDNHRVLVDGRCVSCGRNFVVIVVPAHIMANAMRIHNMAAPLE